MNATIGFVGLGNMGGRMTRRLIDAGLDVIGYDPVTEAITSAGATPSGDVRALAAASDIVFLSLPDSRVVETVILGDDGILEALRPGTTVVDLSTSSPASTREIHRRLMKRNIGYLDAGISGGAAAADSGTLTLMVGGSSDDVARVQPYLQPFAARVFHVGESGAGHVVKLLNNFLNAVALSATAEVMIAGKKAGIDLAVLLDVLNSSSGVNFATLNRFPRIITGDYLEGGLTNTLMLKDVALYAELIGELGVAGLNVPGPMAAFGLARQLGYADSISNTVVDAIGDISGGVRLHVDDRGTR
ncbi:NAD(P)-dependent oxidoreductase [Microbacterium sp. YMB-B2]|uniref:NAD(P)-dependent oxidoreductase n=1 Tax=Microbacterium tenebrionis TaxID=2830665 RepID=A0A9X1LQS8_9MICO|nr:NAD(P)-dependent oxidoreductase [Microbacterium tenebrionis]MCC2030051.1 NAD(P)-dependent oxidoreductase [Microbacterium tenebrionis]